MQLNCPMPKLDFDIITLGHGSGGLLTHRLLDAGVFKLLANEFLDEQHDGALLDLSGKVAFTTDSFVISPIFFPGGNIGELAVNGTVNDIAMCGAIPKYLSLGFILEEGLRMDDLWEIILGVKHAAAQAGVQIVTGDTKVVEKGKGDQIFINTTGIGVVHPAADIRIGRIRPGDQIIVSGEIAAHGIAIMSVREGLEFETDILSDSTNLNFLVKNLLDKLGEHVHFLRDPTRGGVATTLNEIAKKAGLGIELAQAQIPVNEQVDGACELLGLDPLYVANEGKFLAIVAPESADEALELLRKDGKGKNAAIIGHVTENHIGQVLLKSKIGGRRVVNMLPGEQLPRIC
ncbi:MAG: hydrogenase expression/formation protein HypE [Saprospiraceae bacterium]|nr:hydrogenase expression/formation protein HypE [Saprospiraceae bacterium]